MSDVQKTKTDVDIANEKSARIMDAVARMTAYYRANPHRFAKDYLNINLHLFQKILIVMMEVSTNFMFIAARGQRPPYIVMYR